jgi:hypothetical protein
MQAAGGKPWAALFLGVLGGAIAPLSSVFMQRLIGFKQSYYWGMGLDLRGFQGLMGFCNILAMWENSRTLHLIWADGRGRLLKNREILTF